MMGRGGRGGCRSVVVVVLMVCAPAALEQGTAVHPQQRHLLRVPVQWSEAGEQCGVCLVLSVASLAV